MSLSFLDRLFLVLLLCLVDGCFQRIGQQLQRLDARIVFAVRFDDVPRRILGAGLLQHLVDGLLIGVPFLPIAPVLFGDFPLLVRVVLAVLKAF